MQVQQHMTVTGGNYAVYTFTTEVIVLFSIVLYSPTDILDVVLGSLLEMGSGNVDWTYTSS